MSAKLSIYTKLQKIQSLENFVSIAIQGIEVPMYTNTHCFCIFFFFFLKTNKIKTKQPNENRQTTWKYERKVQMHESMILRADKKSSKESHTLDRKN